VLDIDALERKWGIRFKEYFAAALPELEGMLMDGLLTLQQGTLRVLPAGRLLIRNICMVFDRYLHATPGKGGYSRVI
jgi:oxygen-independent coproporphyrinogen-3 oxidase